MEYRSKTQRKKESLHLQVLGEKLVKMPAHLIRDIDMPAEIHEAVGFAKTLKSRGAFRRQMQYIGTLMRKIDPAPVREAIENIEHGNCKKAGEFKDTELLRDELMAGNSTLIEEILKKCPDADRQQLYQLVRNAIKGNADDKPPRASRALFRYLMKIGAGA